MPVEFNLDRSTRAVSRFGGAAADSPGEALSIGLINNMPDSALEATERQFLSLLGLAAGDLPVHLSLYALPEVPRGEAAQSHLQKYYANVETLWRDSPAPIDGLIVTGREPLTAHLAEEPYWPSFTRLVDWAAANTHSTVWSCLAAHAAVLHLDGIERVRSSAKNCGVFACDRISDHPLLHGAPSRFRLPHSRWNGLGQDGLSSHGYHVLTQSPAIGVDSFIKPGASLFLFFQGHPEYEAHALLLEYRRDVARYLKGETEIYPEVPQNYFDPGIESALAALRSDALGRRGQGLLDAVGDLLSSASVENTWEETAVRIYRNWLNHIAAEKKAARSGCGSAPGGALRKAEPMASSKNVASARAAQARPPNSRASR